MPLYDYRCASCGKTTEVRHGFGEPYEGACEACGGALTRVFNPAPIVFKGSGFYATDSRAAKAKTEPGKSESGKPDAGKPEGKPASGKPASGEPAKSETKPAAGSEPAA